jgi:hypothetical protein
MDNFLIYEEIHKRDSCIVYRGRIKRSIDFVMIFCVEKHKRHELSNLVCIIFGRVSFFCCVSMEKNIHLGSINV